MRANATCLTHSSRAISACHFLVVQLDNWPKLRRKLNLVRSRACNGVCVCVCYAYLAGLGLSCSMWVL